MCLGLGRSTSIKTTGAVYKLAFGPDKRFFAFCDGSSMKKRNRIMDTVQSRGGINVAAFAIAEVSVSKTIRLPALQPPHQYFKPTG